MIFISKTTLAIALVVVLFAAPVMAQSYPRLDVKDNGLDVRANVLTVRHPWTPVRPRANLRSGQFLVVNTSTSDIPELDGVNARTDFEYPRPAHIIQQDFLNCSGAASGGRPPRIRLPNATATYIDLMRGRSPPNVPLARAHLPAIVAVPTTLQRGVAKTGIILVCIPADAPSKYGYYRAEVIISGHSQHRIAQDQFTARAVLSVRRP